MLKCKFDRAIIQSFQMSVLSTKSGCLHAPSRNSQKNSRALQSHDARFSYSGSQYNFIYVSLPHHHLCLRSKSAVSSVVFLDCFSLPSVCLCERASVDSKSFSSLTAQTHTQCSPLNQLSLLAIMAPSTQTSSVCSEPSWLQH